MIYNIFPKNFLPETGDKASRWSKTDVFRLETLEKDIVVSFLREKINFLSFAVFVSPST